MSVKSTLLPIAIMSLALVAFLPQTRLSIFKVYSTYGQKATPQMTLWRIDSMHLADGTKGSAILWPCDEEYYFNYHPNTNEDIIIEIKNDAVAGSADLILQLPLVFDGGSFGPLSIIEQPEVSTLAPGEETHFIVRHTGGPNYIHSEAAITINSNDPSFPSCVLNFEVGVVVCGFGLIEFTNQSGCNDNTTTNDASDDFFTADIVINFVSRPGSGNLTVTGASLLSSLSIAAASTNSSTQHTFTNVSFIANGLSSQLTFAFSAEANCLGFENSPAVSSCSVGAVCDLDQGMTFDNNSICNDNGTPSNALDDYFTSDVQVFFANPPATGNLVLNGAGVHTSVSVPVGSLGSGTSHTFISVQLVANGMANLITATFDANPGGCTGSATGPGVNSCSTGPPACDITSVSLFGIGICNNNNTNDPSDDYFIANVAVGYVNPPLTGALQIEPGGDAIGTYSIPVGSLSGNADTFFNVNFKADGMLTVVEVEFTIPANQCVQTISGPTVGPCSPVCDITSVNFANVSGCSRNGTDDPSDDFFTADVIVNFINAPNTGDFQIEPGGDAIGLYAIAVGSLIGTSHTFTNVLFKADGTPTIAEVEFTLPANICVQTQVGPTVPPCSECQPLSIVYVDSAASGVNNGTSWVNAYTKLQDALLGCPADTILVAHGTYYPDHGIGLTNDDRSISFNILDSTVLLGGYFGGLGPDSSSRDYLCNKTILCGEIQQDADSSNNSYHVVTTTNVSEQTVVDGFCITDGNANGISISTLGGGGWYNVGSGDGHRSNPSIVNVIISSNYALAGGGMYNDGYLGECLPHLINVTISGNSASARGGGMFNYSLTSGTSSPRLTNVLIIGNIAGTNGGGIVNSGFNGGTSSPIFTNVVFSGNKAIMQGGAMENFGTGGTTNPTITNGIFWNNAANTDSIISESNSTTTITYSILQSGLLDGGTDITDLSNKAQGTDPLFVNAPAASSAPTADGDFHLSGLSQAINMGLNDSIVSAMTGYAFVDLDGLPRVIYATVDMGAYEFPLNCNSDTLYVQANGSVPSIPIDSFIGIPVNPECQLVIDGEVVTTAVPFDCDDRGTINYSVAFIKSNCDIPDTLYSCIKVITVLDTFFKNFVAIGSLNVSLDAMCMQVLTAHDLLSNFRGCNIDYDVEISYPAGTNTYPSADKLDRSHIGYCMVVSVIETTTGNRTWGRICVEDKAPPQLNCDIIDTVTCFEYSALPNGSYTVNDNCGPPVKVTIVGETFTDYGCDSALLQGVVSRQLVARDQWGNSVNCVKVYHIIKLELDSVICPRDTMVDCSKEVIELTIGGVKKKVSILDPIRSGYPTIKTAKGIKTLGFNNASCKLTVTYKDERLPLCGNSYKVFRTWLIADWCTGEEEFCYQYISVVDTTDPVVTSKILPDYSSTPHDCGQYVNLDTLVVSDCNKVKQTYFINYTEEGNVRVLSGSLPASRVWLPVGTYTIDVQLIDACDNESRGTMRVRVIDNTPPNPVCDEFTQVTVPARPAGGDPATCWAAVAAKDLDNGSRDNCDKPLHFAAALMSDIEKARKDYEKRIVDSCGFAAYWADKVYFDAEIERWINCYVFKDSVQLDECGTQQVVLRVYEADQLPRLDPHLWGCGAHAWFCYNTDAKYRLTHNWNFFRTSPTPTSICNTPSPWLCQAALDAWFASRSAFAPAASAYYGATPTAELRRRLYNDCMINVLVDDKQAPVVAGLQDITIYCDGANSNYNLIGAPGAPDYAYAPFCEVSDIYTSATWPLDIKDSKGVIHGYYGGSSFLDIHVAAGDHEDPQACLQSYGWAPIYCRSWLLVDSFDQAGHVDPKLYFDKLVLFDKTRATKDLKSSEFSITDNCRLDDASLKVTDNGNLNSCSEGWIQRTWTIKDKCGNTVSATQKIIVKHRSDFEVIFPQDKVVTCDFLNRTDTSQNGAGRPTISDDECEQIGVRYTDEIFTVEDSACYKIVRTWTLIDWCIYDPNNHNHEPDVIVDDRLRANSTDRACVYRNIKDNNDGFMQYIQIIKVIDELDPVVTCSDQTVCITTGCSTTVNIPLNGSDNCADEVIFRVDITRPDGTHDLRSNIKAISGTYTEGIYKIKIIGQDRCGNEDTCDMNLTIRDCKKPTPYCINGVATVVMPSTGAVTVWAKDLNLNSEDNCTPKDQLRYSFSADTTQHSRMFICADLSSNGQLQIIPVDIYVTDNAGNQDLCKTYIQLQDNADIAGGRPQGACKDTVASLVGITGKLQTEGNEGVESATVELSTAGHPGIPSFKSKVDGSYQFNSLPLANISGDGKYTIKALRDDQPMNGVSTLDLVLIQKHILGTESLKSPYKIIAADADNSNDVSVIDLIELRKLILGIYDKLPNSTSWKFVPKSYQFSNPLSPWGYKNEETITDQNGLVVKDFVGIKIGDVNATAAAHSLMGTEVRSGETGLIFEVEDQIFKAGDRVEVQFRSPNFKGITGFQGTLQCTMYNVQRNEATSYMVHRTLSVNPGSLHMTDKNIGTRWSSEGLITMSWNTNTSIDLKEDVVLFTMTFVAESDGRISEALRIGSQKTKAESYEGKGELGNLSLRFIGKNGQQLTGKSELFQNYPNPFDQRTVIGINLAEGGKGLLKITDITGRLIKVIEKDWTHGYHEIWLDRREIQASGVLYYSFESLPTGQAGQSFKAVKKMVIIE